MKHLDASPSIIDWNYECMRIPYMYNNNKRWYVPDFIVTFESGVKEMWEVKPEQFLDTERVRNTTAAGTSYCGSNSMIYRLLTKRVMESMGLLLSDPPSDQRV